MSKSIFGDKTAPPDEPQLEIALGKSIRIDVLSEKDIIPVIKLVTIKVHN